MTSPSLVHTDGTARSTEATPTTCPSRAYTGTCATTTVRLPRCCFPVHEAPATTRGLPSVTCRPTCAGSEETSPTPCASVSSTPVEPETVRTDSATVARPELSPGTAVRMP